MRCQGHPATTWFVLFLLGRWWRYGVDSFSIGNHGHSYYQNTITFSDDGADDSNNNKASGTRYTGQRRCRQRSSCRRNRLFHLQCSNTDDEYTEDDDNIDDEEEEENDDDEEEEKNDDDEETEKDPRREFVLENEEPLSVIFQRGLILQRSGQYTQALQEYQFFVKAAENCDVPAAMYAEVHVNMGAVYLRQQQQKNTNTTTTTNQHHRDRAKHHFLVAIQARPLRTAYVNLALLLLQEGTSSMNSSSSSSAGDNTTNNGTNTNNDQHSTRIKLLQEAKAYLYAALDLQEDPSDPHEQTKKVASKLLEDVYTILGKMMRQK